MTNERLPDDNTYDKKYLLSVLRALELEALQLANKALEYSEVVVTVVENRPIRSILPEELTDLFEKIGRPVSHAKAVNLGLRYDKVTRIFKPTAAAIVLNNDAVMDFSASPSMYRNGQFYLQILDSAGRFLLVPPLSIKDGIFTADDLSGILSTLGVFLPNLEQPAEWAEIGAILGNSKEWHSVAEQSILLGPDRQVMIRDTVDGGDFDFEDNLESLLEVRRAGQRTLTIGTETAKRGTILPTSSLQITFNSDNPFEVPKFESISRVPIRYDFANLGLFLPEFIEYPDRERTELETKRRPVQPNAGMLDSFRQCVLDARLSVEGSH